MRPIAFYFPRDVNLSVVKCGKFVETLAQIVEFSESPFLLLPRSSAVSIKLKFGGKDRTSATPYEYSWNYSRGISRGDWSTAPWEGTSGAMLEN